MYRPKNRHRSLRYSFLWSLVISILAATTVCSLTASIINSQGTYLKTYMVNSPNPFIILGVVQVFLILLYIFVFMASFLFMTRKIISYIKVLVEGLHIISHGNLGHRVPLGRKDELGLIAQGMNNMAEQLEKQKKREREQEQFKMDLITGISHDLRTPLTSILGYLELLRTRSFQNAKECDRFIHNAYSKASQLKKLIDDLFAFTRITTGNLKLSLKEVDISSLLEQLLFEFDPIAKENGAEVVTRIEAPKTTVNVDPEYVVRIIDNLLSNSLKYAVDPRTIRISLTCDQNWVYLTVRNKGALISQEQQERLFERFYKIPHETPYFYNQIGVGLGLAVSKQLAIQQNGDLTLKYNSGHYEFTLQLPQLRKQDNI